jgi:hypothetical protein
MAATNATTHIEEGFISHLGVVKRSFVPVELVERYGASTNTIHNDAYISAFYVVERPVCALQALARALPMSSNK